LAAPTSSSNGEGAPSAAARLAFYQRAGGIVTPVLTALVAFVVGGLVVLATGSNPFSTYRAIFEGTGLNWPYLWLTGQDVEAAGANLQQTAIATTALILTGLAVAFAFRSGLFNIGGQGQYVAGAVAAVWIGSSLSGVSSFSHVALAILAAGLAGAVWAGIAGLLKATTGAHEVITTIMLNWVAYWVGSYLVGRGGPLQNDRDPTQPVSKDVFDEAKLPILWGERDFQGLHAGFLIALCALAVFWVVLNRTTLGFEIRAVGFNAEAARYGGMSVRRSYVAAMALGGLFAGVAGAVDVLGWQFRLSVDSVQASQIGFIGIAVALLGRNTAVGTLLSATLFGALFTGTSSRNLSESAFPPELAGNLTLIIQGLVVLFVGADVLILYLWQARRRLRRGTT
jgi:general nucleoside transport system permease protein